ncbi:MAG TPA: A/G-specific adenine glycosylase [Terriglobales bacterium]|jgi:A/G-specific adenine glycosylase|nr:A/G-specific adenine glycosylase [Terriglobales bacterium]
MEAAENIPATDTSLAASPLRTKSPAAFRRALLHWYDENRRDLPWRKTRDPYRIWISEIMLQQTRVAAVLEHYRLFVERFPDIVTLAAASESEVLSTWSGLGYYRRARMMRLCALKIVQDHKGQFPTSSEQLQSLPGIGRYTSAAIASIAFGEPIAVVDGNVERVLERQTGEGLSKKDFWRQAQSLLDQSRPADFNQSMMELGALVCTPRQPKCETCPVRKWCVTQGEAPLTASPQRQSRREIWYTLDERNSHIRLVQRSVKDSLMAGMWELPAASVAQTSKVASLEAGQTQARQPKAAKWRKTTAHGATRGSAPKQDEAPKGRKKRTLALWRTFRHSITVTNYTVHVVRASTTAKQGKWIPIEKISEVPLTGLARKILRAAGII